MAKFMNDILAITASWLVQVPQHRYMTDVANNVSYKVESFTLGVSKIESFLGKEKWQQKGHGYIEEADAIVASSYVAWLELKKHVKPLVEASTRAYQTEVANNESNEDPLLEPKSDSDEDPQKEPKKRKIMSKGKHVEPNTRMKKPASYHATRQKNGRNVS